MYEEIPIRQAADVYRPEVAPDVSPEVALARQLEDHLVRSRIAPHSTGRDLVVCVSDNRLVVDCEACNGGIAVGEGDAQATCRDCGAVWGLIFPDDYQAAKAQLLARAPRLRHYFPTATLARRHRRRLPDTPQTLATENASLGLDHHSWTLPRTWVTGEMVTSAFLNTHLRDNLNETAPALATASGDLFYADAANSLVRLPKGTAGQTLKMNAGATAPEWVT